MSAGVVSEGAETELVGFYDFLFENREGYVHAATKELGEQGFSSTSWKEFFFNWPLEREELIKFTLLNRSRRDVYVAPSLFKAKEAIKDNVIGTNVVWVELDDPPPEQLPNVPEPTCRIASGGDGHEHWYWKIDRVLNSDQLDLINRALTHVLDADPSGWDSTQVLRPPKTFNHKRKRETSELYRSDIVLDVSLFSTLPKPPSQEAEFVPDYIPPVEKVVAKYPFEQKVRDLFQSKDPQDRSDALMALGYYLAEMGMHKPEIFSMLLNADERWGKFKGRDDRMRRLSQIVSIAVTKYPPSAPKVHKVDLTPMGFKTLLKTEVNLEWQWDGFLQKNGYFLLTGPTGVGKTQFTLDAMGHMALGREFLGKSTKTARIGFLSLEMGLLDLKHFLSQLQYSFTPEEQEKLEENLLFFPLGEPLYIASEDIKSQLNQMIGDLKLDGLVIDSLGSATDENVSDEKVKKLFHWNDQLRQRHNIFTWYLHHHRKANGDNRKPNKISDVYGSQYITSYATTVACLWETGVDNHINFITLKKRLDPRDAPFLITRDSNLHFIRAPMNPALQGAQDGPGQAPGTWGPSGPGSAAGGSTAPVTGDWSVGPKTVSDLVATQDYTDDTPPTKFKLDLG